jgi:hypothetical protein
MTSRLDQLHAEPSFCETLQLEYRNLPHLLQMQGRANLELMGNYGLELRLHPESGLVFLGVNAPVAQPHSRWILVVDPDETETWYGVQAEGVLHPRETSTAGMRLRPAVPRERFINDYINQLEPQYNDLLDHISKLDAKLPTPAVVTAYSRVAPEITLDQAASTFRYELPELHEILHHYDAWLTKNPEFADMPRDIVMRMHKLSFYSRYSYA